MNIYIKYFIYTDSSNFPTILYKDKIIKKYYLHLVASRKSGMIEIALAETIG